MPVILEQQMRCTADSLLEDGLSDKLVEIIEGALVTMTPADHYHNVLAFRIQHLFTEFAASNPELEVGYSDEGFLVQHNPDTLLCPDAALFRRRESKVGTWMAFAPELVVEVLSPSNSDTEMTYKRQKFFAAGTEQFWMVCPVERCVNIYFSDGRILRFHGDEIVTGEGVAQGLSIGLVGLWGQR